MLTPPSARAWQSLPSVPGLSSRLIVNSFAVGMFGNLLQLCLGNAGRAFLGNRKIPGFEWKNASDDFLCNLGPVGPSGQGRAGRLQLRYAPCIHIFSTRADRSTSLVRICGLD